MVLRARDVQTRGSADHMCLPFSDQFDGPEPPGWPATLKLPQRVLRGGGSGQSLEAHQAPLSMGFSRQENWSDCHALLQGIFPTQGSNPGLRTAGGFFTI